MSCGGLFFLMNFYVFRLWLYICLYNMYIKISDDLEKNTVIKKKLNTSIDLGLIRSQQTLKDYLKSINLRLWSWTQERHFYQWVDLFQWASFTKSNCVCWSSQNRQVSLTLLRQGHTSQALLSSDFRKSFQPYFSTVPYWAL